ncbi:MAG TPA: hypothetical protein VJ867_00185 [Gemmatimonadaceae bacterium]|nr:hypothetical protein [Gemmatimonadaceae bacterium]
MNIGPAITRARRGAALLLAAALAACNSDRGNAPPPPAPVRVKDIVLSSLPSPFYHFDYDAAGRITAISYASDLRKYEVTYDGDRILRLTNGVPGNSDQLQYVYDEQGRVALVKYVDDSGVFTLVFLTYDGARLTGLERDRRVTGGYIIDKTMAFTYDADGNVHQVTEHRPAIDGVQDASTTVDLYESYDQGVNVDGFSLIHDDFFDHLVLLTDVQLQKGNPARITRTGDGLNFVVDYTYAYDDANRPVTKAGVVTITNGAQAGQTTDISTQFTYY